MKRTRIDRDPDSRRIHVEVDENDIADLLNDLKPLDHDAFAATHRLLAILEDAQADFAAERRYTVREAGIDRT